eukprot:1151181-Pelagomonas_calceolata.AAC.4
MKREMGCGMESGARAPRCCGWHGLGLGMKIGDVEWSGEQVFLDAEVGGMEWVWHGERETWK